VLHLRKIEDGSEIESCKIAYKGCTVWKFGDFSAIQILREINFGKISSPKTANMKIMHAFKFDLD